MRAKPSITNPSLFGRAVWLLLFLLLSPLATRAQLSLPTTSTTTTPAATPAHSDDPLGRGTPHGAVVGFLKAALNGDFTEAAEFLDTKQKGDLAVKLAEQLKAVLDSATSIDLSKISRSPQGSQADPLHPNRELIGTIGSGADELDIYLDRVQKGDEPAVWLFSQDTLSQIPDAYDNLGEGPAVTQKFPGWLRFEVLGLSLWRWFLLIVAIPIVYFLGTWLNRLLRPLLARFVHHIAGPDAAEKVLSLRAPLRVLLAGIALHIYSTTASTLLGRARLHNWGSIVTIAGITWIVMRTVGLVSQLAITRLKLAQSTDRIALTGLLGRFSQIAAFMIGLLAIMQMRGINLTATLAGLGIGGLAVAFAAQKTLENLFGGIMLISDQPFRIGDFCRIGTVEGNVMDIGLRSTRIRTSSRTIVVIPNGQLATMNIENLTLRDKYWFHHIITLKYDTTSDQILAVLKAIRDLIEHDSRVQTDTSRANFIAFGDVSENIEISAYVLAADSTAFLYVQEALLIEIMHIVETVGTEFSLPTQVMKTT